MAEIRTAQLAQFEDIMRFLEIAFNEGWRSFPRYQPLWWQPDTMDYRHTLLMMEDDKITSLVRIFPLDLHLDGARVVVAGIGAVATACDARGRGYMSALLEHADTVMRSEGFPLAILWGDRHRYRHFGYEIANRSLQLQINLRGLATLNLAPHTPSRYYGQAEIAKNIAAAYTRHPYRLERRAADFELLFQRVGLLTFFAGEDDKFAYLAISEGNNAVMEYGGANETVLALAAAVMPMCHLSHLTFPFPTGNLLPAAFLKAAASWTISPVGMMKIIDLPTLLQLFSTQQGIATLADIDELSSLRPPSQVLRLFSTWESSAANVFVWPLDCV